MFRLSTVCLALLSASAISAPVPREEMRPPVPLTGSVWEGDGVVESPTVYEFHPNGRLTVSHSGERYANIGTWSQNGRRVNWEMNDRYCEFEGTLKGTTITGRSWNQPGGAWVLTVRRKSARGAD